MLLFRVEVIGRMGGTIGEGNPPVVAAAGAAAGAVDDVKAQVGMRSRSRTRRMDTPRYLVGSIG